MNATVWLAMLTHQTGSGHAGIPTGETVQGRPMHLSLHTSEDAARAAAIAAVRAEWDRERPYRGLAYSLGPSSGWTDERLLAQARAEGYTATWTEEPVALDGPEPTPGRHAEEAGGLDQGGYGDSYGPAITTGTTAAVDAQARAAEEGQR